MTRHKTYPQAPSTNHKSKRKRKPGNEKYLEFPTLSMLCIETNSILLTKTGTKCLCTTIIILYFRSQPCFLIIPIIYLKTLQRKRSFTFSSEIRIYTCVPQTRYRVIGIQPQPTAGHEPLAPSRDWKCTFYCPSLPLFFCSTPPYAMTSTLR